MQPICGSPENTAGAVFAVYSAAEGFRVRLDGEETRFENSYQPRRAGGAVISAGVLRSAFSVRAHVEGEDFVRREPGFGANQLRLAQGI
jgi:hypothetical protein